VLSQFEIESTLMRNVLNELLHNDEDMVRMLLTERRQRKEVPLVEHHKVSLSIYLSIYRSIYLCVKETDFPVLVA
jgi:hypothetical protein